MNSIEALFEDVRARGDAAVLDATERFDGVRFAPEASASAPEVAAAHAAGDPALLAGIREAIHSAPSTRPRSGRPGRRSCTSGTEPSRMRREKSRAE